MHKIVLLILILNLAILLDGIVIQAPLLLWEVLTKSSSIPLVALYLAATPCIHQTPAMV